MKMKIDLILIVMLLGHVLADFYFQTRKMVDNKEKSIRAVFLHGLLYSLSIFLVFFVCIRCSINYVILAAAVSFAHLMIDLLKFAIKKAVKNNDRWIIRYVFVLDQAAHLLSLLVCWHFLGRNLEVRWFVLQKMQFLPYLPITIFLGILCLLKPTSLLITSTALWVRKTSETPSETPSDDAIKTGEIIGYLERLIVFFMLMYNQFNAIAFVLTAKSLVRFQDYAKDRKTAEYYLIGTLLSIVMAFVITIALGLCVKGS